MGAIKFITTVYNIQASGLTIERVRLFVFIEKVYRRIFMRFLEAPSSHLQEHHHKISRSTFTRPLGTKSREAPASDLWGHHRTKIFTISCCVIFALEKLSLFPPLSVPQTQKRKLYLYMLAHRCSGEPGSNHCHTPPAWLPLFHHSVHGHCN